MEATIITVAPAVTIGQEIIITIIIVREITTTPVTVCWEAITIIVLAIILVPTPKIQKPPIMFLPTGMAMFFKKIIRGVLISVTIRAKAGINHNQLI
jgi:hypothetical protein